MRTRWLAVVATLLAVSAPAPARAGGAVLEFDQEFYVPGEVVRAGSSVWLRSSMGRLEDGPYFAYVSRITSRRMPPPLPKDAVRVAPVAIERRPGGVHGDVAVEFVLPALDPGRYWLTICDRGCSITLGDVMASPFQVAEDALDGRLRLLQHELQQDVDSVRSELHSLVLGHRPDALRQRMTALERDVASLEHEMVQLETAVRKIAARPARVQRSSALPPLLALMVPAALAGIVVGRRARVRR